EELVPIHAPPKVPEQARSLLEREAIAPTGLRVGRNEAGRRAVQVRTAEVRTSSEQGQIGRREAHGSGPRAHRPPPVDPSLTRLQLKPHLTDLAPRDQLARHHRAPSGIPAEAVNELGRAEGSPSQQDVERLEERRLALAVLADEDVQPRLR